MYKYTLFNDNCILHTETNTIIYKDEEGWESFLQWKLDNESNHLQILEDRENTLKWNGGYPKVIDGKTYHHNEEGRLMYIDGEDYTEYYHKNDILLKKDIFKNNIKYETIEYSENEVPWKFTNHELSYIKQIDTETNKLIRYTKLRGELEYVIIYKDDFVLNTTTYRDEDILKETRYFANSNKLKSIKKKIDNGFFYKEYYINGNVRSKGEISLESEMIGEWNFFHQNGNKESQYVFDAGTPISSIFYNERGEIYKSLQL